MVVEDRRLPDPEYTDARTDDDVVLHGLLQCPSRSASRRSVTARSTTHSASRILASRVVEHRLGVFSHVDLVFTEGRLLPAVLDLRGDVGEACALVVEVLDELDRGSHARACNLSRSSVSTYPICSSSFRIS